MDLQPGDVIAQLPPVVVRERLSAATLREQLPWSIADYQLEKFWESTGAGEGVIVGNCDTGIDQRHMDAGDLKGAIAVSRDFTGSASGASDTNGHGTHTAGTIGARHNTQGVASVAPLSKIVNAKVLGDDGYGSDRSVADGIQFCVDEGCDIINCSLGSPSPSSRIFDACEYANQAGVVVVCAAGNEGAENALGFPAAYETPLSVGAIDARKVLAEFSNRSPCLDIVAPGVRILSTFLGGGYAVLDGTSMAAPWISGLVACRISAGFSLNDPSRIRGHNTTPEEIRSAFDRACEDLGRQGRDKSYGRGVPIPEEFYRVENPTTAPDPDVDEIKFAGFVISFSGRGICIRLDDQTDGDQEAT